MEWQKVSELSIHDLTSAIPFMVFDNTYIVARYKEESEGIVLIAKDVDQLIDMIDDTCPKDAMFEIWTKVCYDNTPTYG